MAAASVAAAQGQDDQGREDPAGTTYWPALDALRGLAVAAVLLYHAEPLLMPGGFLGVSLFFTLSGFLITRLAVAEHDRTGRVGLRAFWGRRIRRLLPASLLALILAMAVTAVAVPVDQRADAIGDVRAALANLANWRFILEGASYADLDLVPSPVQHYWSLAIEEQFYLVFPVVALLALRWGRRGLGAVLAAVAAASALAQIHLDDVDRIYFGTDTRAAELAVGGLFALALPHLRSLLGDRLHRSADALAAFALLTTLAFWTGVQHTNPTLYGGGLACIAVVSGLVIVGAVAGRRVPALLARRPLVALGRISYGIYLFHFPLYLLLTEARLGLGGGAVLAIRVTATLAVAAASYHLLEQPIRLRRVLPGRAAVAAISAAVVAVALITVPVDRRLATDLPASFASGLDIVEIEPLGAADVGSVATPSSTTEAVADPATTQAPVEPGPTPGPTAAPAAPTPPDTAVALPPRVPRLLVVGDSTGEANAAGLRAWGERTGALEVASVTSPGCAVLHGPRFRVRTGYVFEPKGCDTLLRSAVDRAQAQAVDAIVVFIGSSQLADWELPGVDGWHHVGDAAFDTRYEQALADAVRTLSAAQVPVLWADVPTPQWDLDAFGAMLGRPAPGTGPTPMNDPARAARLGDLDQRVLAGHPLVERFAYAELLDALESSARTPLRTDGLHLSIEGMEALVDAGLLDRLAVAHRAVVARTEVAIPGGRSPTWPATTSG
ncbi:MAG TPA: acyltransferase family protein [Acidimicrobiales bacterium]|nr:acyltransferase family protein [Acidimicrobiales bacterium]